MKTRSGWVRLATAALAMAVAAPAIGQDDSDDDVAASDKIIVTSTKREEQVQDVPVAVTVISESYLDVAQPQNLLDTTESFETWVDLKFPDDTVRTVLGPLPTTLGPGDEIVAPISPTVPLNASLGDYEIILRAGSYPIDVIHQSFVDVTIE